MADRTPRPGSLPRSGPDREQLRTKGQFWTPDWVAEFMVAYALRDSPREMLDPAAGEGVFLRAARRHAEAHRLDLELHGVEIDRSAIDAAELSGTPKSDLRNIEVRDFMDGDVPRQFPAIVVNPPYIRHHRLTPAKKNALQQYATRVTGLRIDGRAGLHVYFLIRALQSLCHEGRLAYIVSADICEGVFAPALWKWVCTHFCLEAVVTFSDDASPFPGVDTNAMVFMIRNAPPTERFFWMECRERCAEPVVRLIETWDAPRAGCLAAHRRTLGEALATGLSRPPRPGPEAKYKLADFAKTMRGVVTGDNDFFFLTGKQVKERAIPPEYLVRSIGRTRDVEGSVLDTPQLDDLDAKGRPTWLLAVNEQVSDAVPASVREYLIEGEKRGVPTRTLVATRKPWHRMEARKTPPILFAYLGRRNARFIRNLAQVVPLTSFLCVYPLRQERDFVEALWAVLDHPDTIENLRSVGKSYGNGAIKVEPRALERLPLPESLVKRAGLDKYPRKKQGLLSLET